MRWCSARDLTISYQRKMIAIMVLCCRTSTPISLIDEVGAFESFGTLYSHLLGTAVSLTICQRPKNASTRTST